MQLQVVLFSQFLDNLLYEKTLTLVPYDKEQLSDSIIK